MQNHHPVFHTATKRTLLKPNVQLLFADFAPNSLGIALQHMSPEKSSPLLKLYIKGLIGRTAYCSASWDAAGDVTQPVR